MKKIAILICVLSFCSSMFATSTNFMVNLATAKHKAGVEGKLYMVHFTANWCTPCQWMNSHTFTDERVVSYLSDNYVPVKIDVEDFDGIIIKQKNNVQFLPTILIFNSLGEEVARFEEAIGPSKLMAILEENNIPNNKVKVEIPEPEEALAPSAISRPLLPSIFDDSAPDSSSSIVDQGEVSTQENNTYDIIESAETTSPNEINTEEDFPVYTPTTNENNTVVETETLELESEEVEVLSNPYETVEEMPAENEAVTSAAEEMAFLTGEGIFELDVRFKNKQGYSVQVGLYARYENVLAEVNKFKRMYQQKVYVHIGKRNGTPVYRLLLGSFDSKSDANQMEFNLKSQGLDCFVSDLSKL